jgi:hypothetical protein
MAIAWVPSGIRSSPAVSREIERRRAGDHGDREEVVTRDPKALRRRAEETFVSSLSPLRRH